MLKRKYEELKTRAGITVLEASDPSYSYRIQVFKDGKSIYSIYDTGPASILINVD